MNNGSVPQDLTMLDYFAGLALQGLIVRGYDDYRILAKESYEIAKAMLFEKMQRG